MFLVLAMVIEWIGLFTTPCFKPEIGAEAWWYVIKGLPNSGLLAWSVFFWKNLREDTDLAKDPSQVDNLNIYLWMGMASLWVSCGFWGGPVLIWAMIATAWNCIADHKNQKAYEQS